jgi:hypothetical protein
MDSQIQWDWMVEELQHEEQRQQQKVPELMPQHRHLDEDRLPPESMPKMSSMQMDQGWQV